MLAVVKMLHTDFTVKGDIPSKLLDFLHHEYGKALHIHEEEAVPVKSTQWYQSMKKKVRPGDAVRIYRLNRGWTQEVLGKKIGVSKYRVSDYENHRRSISKELAKRLAKLFDEPLDRFV
ncbi:helix-turn-helix domain-containing protein [bacterium]|nr:helix-turn-helix domain-containing protein [bacterium]